MISQAHERKGSSKDEKITHTIASDLTALLHIGQISDIHKTSRVTESVLSEIELAILRSNNPIDLASIEEVTVQGQTGKLLNF